MKPRFRDTFLIFYFYFVYQLSLIYLHQVSLCLPLPTPFLSSSLIFIYLLFLLLILKGSIQYNGSNMLTVYAPRAILKCHLHQDSASAQQAYPCKINNNANLVNCNPKPFGTPCSNILFHSSSSGKCDKLQKSLHLFHHVATHKWLVTMLAGSLTCV